MASDTDQPDRSADFLLQEYSSIEADTQRLRQEGATRLNILIALVGASLAAAIAALTSGSLTHSAKEVIGYGLLAIVGIFSLLCYKYFIDREITTDGNFRALARIRRYFVDQQPLIVPYVAWGTHDNATHQVTHNKSFILLADRHFIATQLTIAAGVQSRDDGLSVLGTAIVVAAAYGLSTVILWWWSSSCLHRAAAAADAEAKFPPPEENGPSAHR